MTALAILRLLPPQARVRGSIHFRGARAAALSESEMRRIRGAGISMIFQEPMTALNPVMRVGDQMAEAVLAHRARHVGLTRQSLNVVRASTSQDAWRLRRLKRCARSPSPMPIAGRAIILISSPAGSGSA